MGDKEAGRERWRDFWNALSEEALADEDASYPEAEQVKQSLLQRLAEDARAERIPPEILEMLEDVPATGSADAAPKETTSSGEEIVREEPRRGDDQRSRKEQRQRDEYELT